MRNKKLHTNLIGRGKENLIRTLNELRDDIISMVNDCGGYINTANNDGENDNIYSAVYDYCEGGALCEVTIKAVKTEMVGGHYYLYAYVAPITNGVKVTYDDEYMKADEDNWYFVDCSSDLLYSYTIHSLADVFEYGEYLD